MDQHPLQPGAAMFDNDPAWPATPDLRGWISLLERRGEIRRLKAPVDPDQEVAAVLERCDGASAVMFEDVEGADFPLIGNTIARRAHFASLRGCEPAEVVARLAAAVASPAPCHELPLHVAPVAAVE